MGEIAYKAARKPARGGRANLVLLRGAVEALPPELSQIADEVNVLLPWGALLEGIVRAQPGVVDGEVELGDEAQRHEAAGMGERDGEQQTEQGDAQEARGLGHGSNVARHHLPSRRACKRGVVRFRPERSAYEIAQSRPE